MTALLAVLAVAGYQHRDKLSGMLGGAAPGPGSPDEAGRFGGQLSAPVGSQPGSQGGIGDMLGNGIRDLMDRFRQAGHGETAESWVREGPNKDVSSDQLHQAIGPDTLAALSKQTGLSHEEILSRLTRELPTAVDRYTPDGRLPTG